MSQRWAPILCLVLLMLLAGCSSPNTTGAHASSGSASVVPSQPSHSQPATNLCNKTLENEGEIIDIQHNLKNPKGKDPLLMVNGRLGTATKTDRFMVYIDQQKTRISDNRTSQCQTALPADLQIGQHIRIQSTGIALLSYPAQIEAVEVIIVS